MSRIGMKPVSIPSGVSVTIEKNIVSVKGSKGELAQSFEPEVSFTISDSEVLVSRANNSKRARAMHGLFKRLLENMVFGVSKGFSKTLLINGVGYRVELQDNILMFNLGFSNPIEYLVPEGVQVTVEGSNRIKIDSIDRQLLGQTAAEIRSLRPPEPYKGKGIRYDNEHIQRKVGKAKSSGG